MAKYLKLFMVALFATLTFTLTSCGDDEPAKEQILQIDGVTYYYYGDSRLIYLESEWNIENDGKSGSINLDYYTRQASSTDELDDYLEMSLFNFSSTQKPCKGMDLAQKDLMLWRTSPMTPEEEKDIDLAFQLLDGGVPYSSGSAIITDVSKGHITIEFKNLKMAFKSFSRTFNGTLTIPFEFHYDD